MQIRVSYRRNQALQVLSNVVQSGGERSVATLMYLLSIQQLTPCPFRLVDEINQGMDEVNRRHAFKAIVSSCSRHAMEGGGSQFFLITPKLLGNLTYETVVDVKFVFNGMRSLPSLGWGLSTMLDEELSQTQGSSRSI